MKNRAIQSLLCLLLIGDAPGKTIPNHAIADRVLGQTDFTTSAPLLPTSSFSLLSPTGIAIDPMSRKVFVADRFNHRILRYPNVDSLSSGAGAEAVLGQARFSTGSQGFDDLGLNGPVSLFFDRFGRLWVADTDNNRVLMFEVASYRETNAYPDRVFGQPDFTTVTSGTTAAKMNLPYAVCVDGSDRLWVSEYGSSRVLRFDTISKKASGAPADGVLGQVNFTNSGAGVGSSGIQFPLGLTVSSGGSLYVACLGSNRVLRFDNAAALGNGSGATVVFGQVDFNGSAPGLSSTSLNSPYGVWITPDDSLWVTDFSNHRILRFDQASTRPTGAVANGVVGQEGFTSNSNSTTERTLRFPSFQPLVDTVGNLWIPDRNNNRILRFPPDVTKPLLAVTSVVPKTTPKKKLLIKGTASDLYGVSKIQYKIGKGSLKTAHGTANWQFNASLKPGKNIITVFATDSVGNVSLNRVVKVKRD